MSFDAIDCCFSAMHVFEFLGSKSAEVMSESALENQLLDRLQEFLLEMGEGFCFEARQKLAAFDHQNIGQLNTCVDWYGRNMRSDGDGPPIGILLCTHKDHALVECALAGMDNRLFVSRYQFELPKKEEVQRFLEARISQLETSVGDRNRDRGA